MEELASLGFISVIPAILAIVLSFATKNTIVALAIACITGTTLTWPRVRTCWRPFCWASPRC